MKAIQRVAVVTGANRGIGLEVSRQLAMTGLKVILTSRNPDQGLRAVDQLRHVQYDVDFFKLDVTQPADIQALRQFLEREIGRLDVLVNNAGVFLDPRDPRKAGFLTGKIDTLEATLEVNLKGPYRLMQALIPLMVKHHYGRIVNVSSGMGALSEMSSGYPAYRISKTALNALTKLAAEEFRDQNILINAASPGWVKTDMGGANATRTVEEGADTITWLATLPDDGPTGGLFHDRTRISW
ncbi:MAG: SDR family oxidoreductase [Candidatus Neomarinimicrobiota bacterium]|nr:MAG: SDR family oxidoreductase [Candidatus Neomarinimicrobiota bacterium]